MATEMMIGVKYDKDRCGGVVQGEDAEGLFQDSFQCLPDGRLQFKSGRRYPRKMEQVLGEHCRHNCTAPRWRRRHPSRFGGGCGCGR